METQLIETLRHARDTAGDLLRDDGFVSHVHRGLMASARTPLSIHYVGRARFSNDCRMFFEDAASDATDGEPHRVYGLARFLLDRRHVRGHLHGVDVGLVDTFLSPGTAWREPVLAPFVEAMLPVRANMEEQLAQYRSVGARKKMQRTLRKGVPWRVSADPAEFQSFYTDMYLPTATTRFGLEASVTSMDVMEQQFRRSGRLLLTEEGEGIAASGALVCTFPHRPRVLHYWKVGVEHCQSLAPTQLTEPYNRLEAALLTYAVREGFAEIHMGWTRAVLNDGVFVHKRRFGCTFHHSAEAVDLAVCSSPGLPPALFACRPVVMWRGAEPVAWLGQDGELDADAEAALLERFRAAQFPPLRSITLFTRGVVRTRDRLLEVLRRARAEYPCSVALVEDA
ncbi:MAG: hypothetical protein HY904_03120 [Deltaproteobacteria bacterium]|nr:hypothetical protein [Deltaproteobacteria bacterium]